MVRTQIQITEALHRRLKQMARRRGISMSEAARRCIEATLDRDESAPTREEIVRNALAVCGKYRDPKGPRSLGRDHDLHLGEILSS